MRTSDHRERGSAGGLLRRVSRYHRTVVWLTQVLAFLIAGFGAFLLRFDFSIPDYYRPHLAFALVIWMAVKSFVFVVGSLDRGWWRYVSLHDLVQLAAGNAAASALAAVLIRALVPAGFPRSIYILDLALCFLVTAGSRVVARLLSEAGRRPHAGPQRRALIYGAGDAGVSLLREIRQTPSMPYRAVGFVDDDPRKTHMTVTGLRVLGTGDALPRLVARRSIDIVLIAIPSATGAQMSAILGRCQEAGVESKTTPSLSGVIEGKALAAQMRDVAVEDILGRTPVRLEDDQIHARLSGEVVLITGAAGSIGAEICRQVARYRPRAIIAFEIAETGLFEIDREMTQRWPEVPFVPEIGSIRDPYRLEEVFAEHRPSIVYHAAAYKHVPMMEIHPFEAVDNNVFGTRNVALAAARYGVRDFVMISSDKAVRPTNIMGATKRLAELLIRSLQNGGPKYVSVRFGNVLGSSGSVVPIFKRQIAEGGPVTVTHPEMRRYFMTIPEACHLVLQASTMGHGGEIFVLDMGEPVRIVDLARNLILLSGLRPDRDIPIVFTGVRPGEKLSEELSVLDEDTLPTFHPKIKIFAGNAPSETSVGLYLDRLRAICDTRAFGDLILAIKEMAPEYNPSSEILRRGLTGRKGGIIPMGRPSAPATIGDAGLPFGGRRRREAGSRVSECG